MAELRIPKHKRQTEAHTRSRFQEKEKAQRLGAIVVHRSGAGDTKGDVRVKKIARIECKTTLNNSFSVTREMVSKIENAALSSGEVPALVVEFLNPGGKVWNSVVILPAYAIDLLQSR